MEEIIEKIIEIEERARDIVKDAETAKEHLDEDILNETARLKKDISVRADKKNEVLRAYEDGEADKKIEKINEQMQKVISSLESKFEENRDKWVEDIFNSVVR